VGKHETGYERSPRDFYPTRERWVTEALLAHVDLGGLTVWEPAAGEGHMAEVLKTAGAARVYCSDIVDRGYALDAIHNFTLPTSPDTGAHFDAIVTNPPFGLRAATAEQFVASGLRHIAKGGLLALLLPTDFDSASRRRPLFHDCPWFAARISLTRRIVWFERADGEREAPKENHAWFVWQRTALRARATPITLYGPSAQQISPQPGLANSGIRLPADEAPGAPQAGTELPAPILEPKRQRPSRTRAWGMNDLFAGMEMKD
jgi:hypothetical protein